MGRLTNTLARCGCMCRFARRLTGSSRLDFVHFRRTQKGTDGSVHRRSFRQRRMGRLGQSHPSLFARGDERLWDRGRGAPRCVALAETKFPPRAAKPQTRRSAPHGKTYELEGNYVNVSEKEFPAVRFSDRSVRRRARFSGDGFGGDPLACQSIDLRYFAYTSLCLHAAHAPGIVTAMVKYFNLKR